MLWFWLTYEYIIYSSCPDICWGPGLAETAEGCYNIDKPEPERLALSPQFLVDSVNSESDSASNFKKAVKILESEGLPAESIYRLVPGIQKF